MGDIAALPQRASSSVGVGARVGRIAFWSLVVGLSLYFVVQNGVLRNTVPYLTGAEPFTSRHGAHGALLLLHIVAGTAALLIGPLQFSATLRRRNLALHRWSGRVYLVSVAVSVVAAIRILLLPHSSFGFRIGTAGLALAWIATTAVAYAAVRARQIPLHKEWMIRSYVVTFGFVFFRLPLGPLFSLEIATRDEIATAVSWMCWALPLLVTEVVLSARKIVQARAVVSGRRAATAVQPGGR
jgi:hypothetical protein